MPLKTSQYIWHEGKLVPWAEATVHVLTHALHYGSSVFEGVRVYQTPSGPMGFRLTDHIRRMLHSAKVYRLKIPYSQEVLVEACKEVIRANSLTNGAYIRPIAFRGYGEMGVAGNPEQPASCSIAAWEWGSYLGEGGLEKGVDVCVSSWQRVAPNTIPAMAKAAGNYLSSILVTLEARRLGFAEGLALNSSGFVSEGAGENLFLVQQGVLYTPPVAASILAGLTRDTVMKLAESLGVKVVEQNIPREWLYIADEVFLTGSAAEITPVRSIDRITIGEGRRGPLTERLQKQFFGLFDGSTADRWGWLEPILPGGKAHVERTFAV
ncbi:branched-chain amino acid transaminase [Gaiella sp.]|uniref:branched-chain amino acid transaminase n=1 Tax=Gaiella sp. TaxID=2663207 RepID=UPI002E2FCF44|nr:branched-chain amino acid transaminase [Gaiella sp.]HEX5584333.1 branched-chain amino acid transaminase [Gaiella sp.]